MRSESRSRIEYLILKNKIIVLDSYFKFTNKSNLIDRLLYDLILFVDNLVMAYFLGHPVYTRSICKKKEKQTRNIHYGIS